MLLGPKALERNLIMLNNFMPHGLNEADSHFLHNLKKGMIRKRNVTVIILTPREGAACCLLAQNNLAAIVPLATPEQIVKLRREYRNFDPKDTVGYNWNQELDMVWDKSELKKDCLSQSVAGS